MDITIVSSTPSDHSLPTFDFTKLNAINTCPRWGIIRYGHHKAMSASGRALALEAGEACHQVFAAARIFDLITYGDRAYKLPRDALFKIGAERGRQLFGHERSNELLDCYGSNEDERTKLLKGALFILETSGFYDDPSDKRRTLDKLSESCIAYLDRYEFGKNVPYVRNSFVGIEVPFDLRVDYVVGTTKRSVRFTGRIDGVHCRGNNPDDPIVEENKTASRLNDAWELSFETSHQVTGYIAATNAILGTNIDRARVYGIAIPQPRVYDAGGYTCLQISRKPYQTAQWAAWFAHTCEQYFKWYDNPLDAPMYTGSCNRYFRPCSFIPLCASEREDQQEYFEMMVHDEWSPLHEKAED